jgi:hypothetical protein
MDSAQKSQKKSLPEEISELHKSLTTHKEGTLEHRTAVRNINTKITELKDFMSILSKKSSTSVASAADTPLQAEIPTSDEIIITLAGLMMLEEPDIKKDFWRRLSRDKKDILEKAKLKKAEFLESKPDVVQEEPVVVFSESMLESTRLELNLCPRFLIIALIAFITQIGVKKNSTKCDNEHKYRDLCSTIEEMLSRKVPSNDITHRAVKSCRDNTGCDECRGLCVLLTILRFPENPMIDEQVYRCVWHGSRFAKKAIVALIRLRLGPNSSLALMIEQGHDSLYQFLLDLNVEETPAEKHEREQNEERVRADEKMNFERKSRILRIASTKGDKRDTNYTPCGKSDEEAKEYAKAIVDAGAGAVAKATADI